MRLLIVCSKAFCFVIPAKGILERHSREGWNPEKRQLDSRLRGNDGVQGAGMTECRAPWQRTKLALVCVLLASLGCGCATREKPEPAKPLHVQAMYTRCPRPGKVAVRAMKTGEHIGSAGNVAIAMHNVDTMAAHIKKQDAALDCYEQQAGKP